MISKGTNICGQVLDVDPRTGKTEVNTVKPYTKRDWNRIARPHVVTVTHADGRQSLVTIAGASHSELRDADFVGSVATGGSVKHKLDDWHKFVIKLAAKHPHLVVSSSSPSIGSRVIVAAMMAGVRLK